MKIYTKKECDNLSINYLYKRCVCFMIKHDKFKSKKCHQELNTEFDSFLKSCLLNKKYK